MTRAKDISKILTDADISGTLDVSGAFTSQGIDDNANATAITISSGENVGIGVVPETTWNSNIDALQLGLGASIYGDNTATGLQISANTVATLGSSLNGYKYISSDKATTYQQYDGHHNFRVASSGSADGDITWTTALTIDDTGSVLIGTTTNDAKLTVNGTTNPLVRFYHTESANEKLLTLQHAYSDTSNSATMIEFRDNGSTIRGSITTSSFNTTYNTTSDYRLKESVTYDFDATTRLKQLKPCRFNWIADETNTLVDGFLAHEVSGIIPEAITGKKDAMTEEVLYVNGDEIPDDKKIGDVKEASVIDPQLIDQSKIVPLLVKTIQELEARITALESA